MAHLHHEVVHQCATAHRLCITVLVEETSVKCSMYYSSLMWIFLGIMDSSQLIQRVYWIREDHLSDGKVQNHVPSTGYGLISPDMTPSYTDSRQEDLQGSNCLATNFQFHSNILCIIISKTISCLYTKQPFSYSPAGGSQNITHTPDTDTQ